MASLERQVKTLEEALRLQAGTPVPARTEAKVAEEDTR